MKYLKEKFDVKLIALLLNPLKKNNKISDDLLTKYYDMVITTDYQDSLTYNFDYMSGIYSNIAYCVDTKEDSCDLFFVGVAKDRLNILHDIYKNISKKVKCDFNIINVKESDQEENSDIKYNKRLSYTEVLDKVSSSNCILEVLQSGQSGVTLRTLEAIIFNKKLLTNNQQIIHSPFYDSRYIYI